MGGERGPSLTGDPVVLRSGAGQAPGQVGRELHRVAVSPRQPEGLGAPSARAGPAHSRGAGWPGWEKRAPLPLAPQRARGHTHVGPLRKRPAKGRGSGRGAAMLGLGKTLRSSSRGRRGTVVRGNRQG